MRLLEGIGSRCVVVACACAGVLAWAAGPALADGTSPDYPGSILHVTTEGQTVVGNTLTIIATGSNAATTDPVTGEPETYDFGVQIIDVNRSIISLPCYADFSSELNLTFRTGAYLLTPTAIPEQPQSGPFQPVSFQAPLNGTPGQWLICAYTVNGLSGGDTADDAAWASTQIDLLPRSGATTGQSGRGKPAEIARPSVRRAGGRLQCARGSWSGHPTSYRYRWTVVHASGVAGVQSSLGVTSALVGHQVECSVTAKSSKGSATATSRPFRVT